MAEEWDFELVAGPYGTVADGPCWDGHELLFTLVGPSRLLAYDPASGTTRDVRKYTIATRGLALGPDGALYGCQAGAHRIVRFDKDGSTSQLAVQLDGLYHNQPDDLAIDRAGRIWFSDPRDHVPGAEVTPTVRWAAVLRLEQDTDGGWSMRRMTTDTEAPHGLALAPDEHTLYVAEDGRPGARSELRAYSIEGDGTLGAYRVLHTFGSDQRGKQRGVDGMCVDADGNIVGCAGASGCGPGPMIYVWSSAGRILETHPAPADRPINCAFGDGDLGSLYVTTAEGHLFRVRNSGLRGGPPS